MSANGITHHALKFSDVSGEVVGRKQCKEFGRRDGCFLSQLLRGSFEEMGYEQGDIFLPFVQRRQVHMVGSEAKVEIVAKSSVRHQGFDRPIRGDNRSSLAGSWGIVAQSIVLSILQKAQELELRLHGEVPDFVKEQRAV